MYYYLFDSFLSEKKYEKYVHQVERRLTDLGLHSKVGRLTILNNVKELIADQIKRGVKTVVAVGNDKTFLQCVSAVAPYDGVVLGFIPIGVSEKNSISRALGIPSNEYACDILSSRIIETVDLGKINSRYFFLSARIQSSQAALFCDEKYHITTSEAGMFINVCNFYLSESSYETNPKDGYLETIVSRPDTFWGRINKRCQKIPIADSLFINKKIEVHGEETIPIILDDSEIINSPATIEIVPQKLQIIVGKERVF